MQVTKEKNIAMLRSMLLSRRGSAFPVRRMSWPLGKRSFRRQLRILPGRRTDSGVHIKDLFQSLCPGSRLAMNLRQSRISGVR